MKKRTERIKFWLTDKELKQIDRKAKKLGMNRSEYIHLRNGKHYVPVRMTKSEKDKFLRLSTLCRAPEKTVLYWLVNDMIVNEKPPEIFFKITRLLLRLQTNVDHIWLGRSNLSETTKHKYHKFSKELNDRDCEITFKGLFAEAHYGENHK